MEKVLLLPSGSRLGNLATMVEKRCPGIKVTANFEQVYAQVKLGEVERVCMVMDTATETAYGASIKFHEINKNLPVLVWDEVDKPEVNTENNMFLSNHDYTSDVFLDIMEEFFHGTLSLSLVSKWKQTSSSL